MLESWILTKLEPLKTSLVILLRDPQRMIRPGAHAVDCWAMEHGFSVLFCTGNLALREMYKRLRLDDEAKVLLVDRSRGDTPIFYPDFGGRLRRARPRAQPARLPGSPNRRQRLAQPGGRPQLIKADPQRPGRRLGCPRLFAPGCPQPV
jgi:hypothetical protein